MQKLLCLLLLALPTFGCASATFRPPQIPDGETVIQIDEQGRITRGDDDAAPRPPQDSPTDDPPALEEDGEEGNQAGTEKHNRFLAAYEQTAAEGPTQSTANSETKPLEANSNPSTRGQGFDPFAKEKSTTTRKPTTSSPHQLASHTDHEQPNFQPSRAVVPAVDEIAVPPGVQPSVVNTLRFELDYNDQVLGEAGIAKVEFYGTKDNGRTWQRLGEDADRRSPYTLEMPSEGLYGFRIAVTGKNGLASRPPKNGDLPELWVKVDRSEPLFRGNLRPAGSQRDTTDTNEIASAPATPAVTTTSEAPLHDRSNDQSADELAKTNPSQSGSNDPPADVAALTWSQHLQQAIVALENKLAGNTTSGDPNATLRQTLRQALGDNGDTAATIAQASHNTPLSEEDRRRTAAQLRLLYLAAGQHEQAVKTSPHVDTQRNEFWSHQMLGLKLLMDENPSLSATRQATIAMTEIRDAHDALSRAAELEIKNLAFCTSASSFGVYETTVDDGKLGKQDYRDRKFKPEQPIVLYFEVDNFTSEQFTTKDYPDGAWKTSLKGSYTIFAADGRPLDRRELKLRDDTCRNRRRDYFVAYRAWVPDLAPGNYTLELLVEDQLANKIGTSSIDFEVVSKR